jgi:hypothetical protein
MNNGVLLQGVKAKIENIWCPYNKNYKYNVLYGRDSKEMLILTFPTEAFK